MTSPTCGPGQVRLDVRQQLRKLRHQAVVLLLNVPHLAVFPSPKRANLCCAVAAALRIASANRLASVVRAHAVEAGVSIFVFAWRAATCSRGFAIVTNRGCTTISGLVAQR